MKNSAQPDGLGAGDSGSDAARPFAVALLVIVLGLFLIEHFHGIFPNLMPAFQRLVDPTLYAFDPAVQNALIGRGSVLFSVVGFLGIDVTVPVVNVAFYLVTAALGAAAVVLINRHVFSVRGLLPHLLLLALLLLADDKPILYLKTSWLIRHAFTVTMVATALRLFVLYFMLRRNYWPAVACVAILLAVSVKSGWMIWLILAVVIALDRPARWPVLLAALALALVYPLLQALALPHGFDAGFNREAFETLALAHPEEDNPFRIGPFAMIAALAAGAASLWLAARLDTTPSGQLTRVVRVTLALSAVVFIGGGLYITWGYRLLPVPAAVLLSPVRAMEVAAFLFYIMALVWILRAPSLDAVARLVLLVALSIFRMQVDRVSPFMGVALVLALAAAGWLALRHRHGALGQFTDRWLTPGGVALMVALFLVASAVHFRTEPGRRAQNIDYDSRIGFVLRGVPVTARTMLAEIRALPDRGPVVFVRDDGGRWAEPQDGYWQALARVSGLSGDLYYLPHVPRVWRVVLARNADVAALLARLNAPVSPGHGGDVLRGRFAAQGAMVVLPDALVPWLAGWSLCRRWPGWVALVPDANEARRRACPVEVGTATSR